MGRPDPGDPMVDGTVMAILLAAAVLCFVVDVALIITGTGS